MVADFDERAGDHPAAIATLEAAIETNETLIGGFTGSLLARLGWVLLLDGQLDRAESVYQHALDSARRVRHPTVTPLALAGVAALHRLRGRDDAAREAATEGLEIHRAGGPRRFRHRIDLDADLQIAAAVCCDVLAAIAADADDPVEAAERLAGGRRPPGRGGGRRARLPARRRRPGPGDGAHDPRLTREFSGSPAPDQRPPGWWPCPRRPRGQIQEDPVSAFLYRLGRSSARHPFRVLGAWLVAAIAVVALQGSAGGEFENSERVPGVESQHAADVLTDRFPSQGGLSARIVLHTDDGRLDDAAHAATVERGPRRPRRWRRRRRRHRPAGARVRGRERRRADRLRRRHLRARQADRPRSSTTPRPSPTPPRPAACDVELTGALALLAADEPSSELIGVGVAIIVLLVAFGSVVAMGLPIGTALIGHLRRRRRRRRAVRRHGRPRVLADPLRHDRPRRRHRLRAVHRHPAPPAPPRRHERRGRRRHRQRHRRPGGAVRRHDRRHRHPRAVPRRASGHQRHGRGGRARRHRLDGRRGHAPARACSAWPGRRSTSCRSTARRHVAKPAARRRSPAGGRTTWASTRSATPAVEPRRPVRSSRCRRSACGSACPTTATPPTDTTQRAAYDLLADGFGPGFNGPIQVVVELPDAERPGRRGPDPRRAPGRPRHRRRHRPGVQRRRRHRGADGQPDHRAAGRRDRRARPSPPRRRAAGHRGGHRRHGVAHRPGDGHRPDRPDHEPAARCSSSPSWRCRSCC